MSLLHYFSYKYFTCEFIYSITSILHFKYGGKQKTILGYNFCLNRDLEKIIAPTHSIGLYILESFKT